MISTHSKRSSGAFVRSPFVCIQIVENSYSRFLHVTFIFVLHVRLPFCRPRNHVQSSVTKARHTFSLFLSFTSLLTSIFFLLLFSTRKGGEGEKFFRKAKIYCSRLECLYGWLDKSWKRKLTGTGTLLMLLNTEVRLWKEGKKVGANRGGGATYTYCLQGDIHTHRLKHVRMHTPTHTKKQHRQTCQNVKHARPEYYLSKEIYDQTPIKSHAREYLLKLNARARFISEFISEY